MLKLRSTLLLIFLTFALLSTAQKKITGYVFDEEKKPLDGISIMIKGTKIGAKSAADGSFSITVPADRKNNILVFTSINYLPKEVVDNGTNLKNVELTSVVKDLDDVVVIGYGTQRKRDVTGSVAKVNMSELQKAPVRNIEEALAGRVAGVQVTSTDGQPGSSISIVIRGNNSITQDNSPLYVVDGFPIENPNNNSINPNDIESMEVLKDASATAIYGARAANGVIMITTKKGSAGKTKFTYNTFYATQDIINKIPVLSPYEFVKYQFELDSARTKSQYFVNGNTLETFRDLPGIDWQDATFRKAPMVSNSLSMSGGNAATKFFVSMSAINQDGIVKYSGYNRYQGRLRLDNTVNDKLKIGFNLNYSALKSYGTIPSSLTNSSSQSSNLMYSVWGYRPIDGNLSLDLSEGLDPYFEGDQNDSRFNPLETVKYELRNRFSNTIFANATIEYELIKDLKFKALIGYTSDMDRNEEFNSSNTRSGSPKTVAGRNNGVNGSIIYNNTNTYVSENTLSYNKKFDKNNTLDIVTGFTFQGINKSLFGAAAAKLPNEVLGLSGLDEGTPTKVSSLRTSNTLASFLGRVNYGYKGKYLATVSFRTDGSSKFSENNKWSFFPSASLAWRLSQEKFVKSLDFVSDAKVRVSYGLVGNNRVSDFASLSTLNSPITSAYPFNGTLTSSTIPLSLGNPNLIWETTAQTDAGLDLGLFNNKVSLTVDVYKKVTRDLLLNADLPPSSGFVSAFKNIGKVENKGLEIALGFKLVTNKKFSWSSNFNVAFNRNKVLGLNDGQESLLSTINWDNQWRGLPAYIAKIGQPVGLMYGYVWDGLYQYADFDKSPSGAYALKANITSNTTTASSKIQPGHIKYKDLNGDFVINDNDKTIIGNATPNFTGGFINNFTYSNFDVSIFLQFVSGNQLLNANRYVFEGNSGRTFQNQYATVLNRWTPTNQNNEMFIAKGDGDKQYSSRAIEDGSFLRLKTLQIGYNAASKGLKKAGISSLRCYVSGQNLITWTKYSGFDPEVSAYNSALTPGFDYSVYPRARTLTVGLNINF